MKKVIVFLVSSVVASSLYAGGLGDRPELAKYQNVFEPDPVYLNPNIKASPLDLGLSNAPKGPLSFKNGMSLYPGQLELNTGVDPWGEFTLKFATHFTEKEAGNVRVAVIKGISAIRAALPLIKEAITMNNNSKETIK